MLVERFKTQDQPFLLLPPSARLHNILPSCQADPESIEHLRKVLRKKGMVKVFWGDGSGNIAEGELSSENRVSLSSPPVFISAPTPRVHLVQAKIKKKSMEWLLQKSTELGVASLSFFASQHSVQETEPEKKERIEKIVRAAAEQSRNPHLPKISASKKNLSQSVEEIFSPLQDDGRKIFFWGEWRQAAKNFSFFQAQEGEKNFSPQDMYFINGPEGGWSEEESLYLKNRFRSIVLSKNVLRAETAAVAALSVFIFFAQNTKGETNG